MATQPTLREVLAGLSRPGELYTKADDGTINCYACGHRCKILPGREGICKVRFSDSGILRVPYGYVGGLATDPIEKKPFFHVMPGSTALSFGMLGCDYHCSFCQNWYSSQTLRDPMAGAEPQLVSAEQIVGIALERHIPVITSTYNEPLITSEWAVEVFKLAKPYGIRCSYVSNGNATPEVLEYLRPYIDFFKVDLKSFRQKSYQQMGGTLQIVLDTIKRLKTMGIWVEVVTLVVPGMNDDPEELADIAGFLASVSPDIPWHVTAFHEEYKMTGRPQTSSSTLRRAAEIGYAKGLHYVYAGNLPGRTAHLEDTRCPSCGATMIERTGFTVSANRLVHGNCSKCGQPIAGVWE
jgi:pyruvate formate lyase activating enzyme